MKHATPSFTSKAIKFMASSTAFRVIMCVFLLQAIWIALTGRFPMAFDEEVQLGIIKIYSHHISPFLAGQPDGANSFGALARDPSYLYQYLMSFPYRLVAAFTSDLTTQVLFLRAINIAIFAGVIAVYRKLLLAAGGPRALVHACLAVFVLIPVVPLLAAHINYDSLFLLVSGVSLLLTVQIGKENLRQRHLDVRRLMQFAIVGLLGSLIKYAFLPIFVAEVVYLFVVFSRTNKNLRSFAQSVKAGFIAIERRTHVLFVVVLVIALGLFLQRYGVNIVKYHNPVAECDQVLTIEQCSEFSPWVRDYNLSVEKSSTTTKNPLIFTADWFYGMWLRLFFAVDGPTSNFQTRGPLIIPGVSAIVFAVSTVGLAIAYSRKIWQRNDKAVILLFLGATALYIVSLWMQEYKAFVHTGQAVAINGRYLFPVLPLLFLLGAWSWAEALRQKPRAKLLVASVAIVSLLWGGGVLTYILRSNDAWYWPNSPLRGTNHAVQKTLGPITPGYDDPIAFMHHRY